MPSRAVCRVRVGLLEDLQWLNVELLFLMGYASGNGTGFCSDAYFDTEAVDYSY